MNITINAISPTQAVVQVDGRLDAETADSFKVKAKEVAATGVKYVTVDIGKLTFIDSSGLSAIVSTLKLLRQNSGSLNLACVGPQANTALRLTMLDKVLSKFDTVDEATKSLVS
ncbi:MAG: STAS domain-containing protein [Chloroflexota bacterium]